MTANLKSPRIVENSARRRCCEGGPMLLLKEERPGSDVVFADTEGVGTGLDV